MRAELAQELGFYPASVEPEDVARYREQTTAQDEWQARAGATSLSRDQVAKKYAHLSRRG